MSIKAFIGGCLVVAALTGYSVYACDPDPCGLTETPCYRYGEDVDGMNKCVKDFCTDPTTGAKGPPSVFCQNNYYGKKVSAPTVNRPEAEEGLIKELRGIAGGGVFGKEFSEKAQPHIIYNSRLIDQTKGSLYRKTYRMPRLDDESTKYYYPVGVEEIPAPKNTPLAPAAVKAE